MTIHRRSQFSNQKKKMRSNCLSLSSGDANEGSGPPFYWWRSAEEFHENGRLKIDLSKHLQPHSQAQTAQRNGEAGATLPRSYGRLAPQDHGLPLRGSLPSDGRNQQGRNAGPTILLVGIVGTGKSSLAHLMYSVFCRSGLIPFAQTSRNSSDCRTMYLEEHNVRRSTRTGFCVFDSRGVEYDRMSESLNDVWEWMEDGVHHRQE